MQLLSRLWHLSFCFYQQIFSFLTWPLEEIQAEKDPLVRRELQIEQIHNTGKTTVQFIPPSNSQVISETGDVHLPNNRFSIPPGGTLLIQSPKSTNKLVIYSPLDGMTTSFKICFWISLVGTAPFWLYTFLQFVIPALRIEERRLLAPFLALSTAFLTGGAVFAFLITIPFSNSFLWSFNAGLGNNLWSLSAYLDYTLFLLLANALAFQLALVLFFLVHLRIITTEWMINNRRYSIIGILILAALLTPPDVLSQLMLAIPMMGLYEAAILYSKYRTVYSGSKISQ